MIPRNKLKDILQREELCSQAVYFLIGESEEGLSRVYVGEAEDFRARIQQHNKTKDYWNAAVCFISKDENLNKAHVKYLESSIIKEMNRIQRVEMENGNVAAMPKLSESDKADMDLFLENIRIVLSTLGMVFLEDVAVHDRETEEVYFVKGRGADAMIKLTNEGYVIQSGSIISGTETSSFKGHPLSAKRLLFFSSTESEKLPDGNYKLLGTKIFSSPSTAAAFILGRSTNGWAALKDKIGKTLDELKRQ
jgi:hypothetical protein